MTVNECRNHRVFSALLSLHQLHGAMDGPLRPGRHLGILFIFSLCQFDAWMKTDELLEHLQCSKELGNHWV